LPELPRPNPEDTKSPSLSRSRGSARPGRQSITFDADAPAATVFSRVLSLFYRRPRLDLPRFAIERSADDTRLSHGEPEKATAVAGADVTSSRGIQEPPFDRSAGSRSGTRANSLIAGSLLAASCARDPPFYPFFRFVSAFTSEARSNGRLFGRLRRLRDPIEDFYRPLCLYRAVSAPSFEYVSGRCAAPRRDER